jgi:hypothetical protein
MTANKTGTGVPGEPPASVLNAVRLLLRPLVRALISYGVTFPQLADILKAAYVDAANSDFQLDGRPPTDSRVTLLTGVHRKDVKRLRTQPTDSAPSPRLSLNAQMIALWAGALEFLDENARPRPLPRRPDPTGGPSFDALVERISKDIRPRVVLDEWRRLGIVTVGDDDLVRLEIAAFVPREGLEDLAFLFGANLHDHIAASSHNLMRAGPPFFERAVYYDHLSPASAAAIRELAGRIGMDALLAVNREASDHAERDKSAADAGRRIRFGIYFYDADDSDGRTG